MSLKLRREELREAANSLYEELCKGESESFIAEIYGWDTDTFERIKKIMLTERADANRGKPRDHVYVEYVASQRANIQDLTDLITNLDKSKQYNALVGALRLRADLQDRIIDRGMELGIIRKEPERKEVVAGILIADMGQTELRAAIVGELTSIKEMMEKFGDKPLSEVSAGSTLHYGPRVAVIDADIIETEVASGG